MHKVLVKRTYKYAQLQAPKTGQKLQLIQFVAAYMQQIAVKAENIA